MTRYVLDTDTFSLKIASIALELGAVAVTANTRDFGRVPGLAVENWAM